MTPTTPPERERRDSHPAIDALKRHWAVRLLLVVLPAVVSSIAAYNSASGDAEVQAKVVKDQAEHVEDKAEAGYKVASGTLEYLREEVRRLDAELVALKRAVRAGSKRVAPPPKVVAAPAPAAAPPPLPADLTKALEQVQRPLPAPAGPTVEPVP